MQLRFALILICALAFPHLGSAQADSSVIQKIINEGKTNNQAPAHLKYLSKNIGHRLTASPNLDRAYKWTQQKFKEFGCVNVHLEEWSEWPVGFHRGKSSGAMTKPEKKSFEFTTPSWGAGTNGRTKGQAIIAPKSIEEFNSARHLYKNKWVIYPEGIPRTPRTRPGQEPPAIDDALKARLEVEKVLDNAQILGRVAGSRNELVLTSGNFRDLDFNNLPTQVAITVRKSDMDSIVGHLSSGKPVELEFDLNHKFVKGPIKNYNVVAEIPGTDLKDEVVIMGGHIDTWDGPGTEGAADNGNGVATALEAARILNKVGIKPRRTIRFVLFSGEEQGLFGSLAYVQMHKEEMDKISAVFIEDGGANYEGGTYALESMLPEFQPIVDAMNQAFPDLPYKMRTVNAMPRGGGSDHVPFNAIGVPGFFWDEVGTVDYNFVHHTQHDRFELVPSNYLIQSATNSALACYVVAMSKNMMPRAPKPAATGGSTTQNPDPHDHD